MKKNEKSRQKPQIADLLRRDDLRDVNKTWQLTMKSSMVQILLKIRLGNFCLQAVENWTSPYLMHNVLRPTQYRTLSRLNVISFWRLYYTCDLLALPLS